MRLVDRIPALRARSERRTDRRLPRWVFHTPSYIQVEVINRCNFSCIMCPIRELTAARPRRLLTVEEFAGIAGQFPALRRVDLQGIGEPSLNPHLEGIIAWCAARAIEVGFVTNGVLLDRERIRELYAAGLSHMVFSMDSVDPEVYGRIRKGGRLESLLAAIGHAVALRREMQRQGPFIGVMAVAMKDNLEVLPALVAGVASLGVDALTIKGLNTGPNPEQAPDGVAEVVARIQAAAAANPSLPVTIAVERDPERLRCRWPWTAAYITAEGDLTPCCNCPDSRVLSLGNLHRTSFEKLWNARAYRKFRRELGNGMPAICSTCPDY